MPSHRESLFSSAVNRMSFAASSVVLGLGLLAYASDQGHDNPFQGRNENGEKVHVLPSQDPSRLPPGTQPTFAAPHRGTQVFGGSYGSGDLVYYAVRSMPPPSH